MTCAAATLRSYLRRRLCNAPSILGILSILGRPPLTPLLDILDLASSMSDLTKACALCCPLCGIRVLVSSRAFRLCFALQSVEGTHSHTQHTPSCTVHPRPACTGSGYRHHKCTGTAGVRSQSQQESHMLRGARCTSSGASCCCCRKRLSTLKFIRSTAS